MKNSSCHTFYNLLKVFDKNKCIDSIFWYIYIKVINNIKKNLALFKIEKQQPMPLFLKKSCRYLFLSQYHSIMWKNIKSNCS